jgi:hypothetical protein
LGGVTFGVSLNQPLLFQDGVLGNFVLQYNKAVELQAVDSVGGLPDAVKPHSLLMRNQHEKLPITLRSQPFLLPVGQEGYLRAGVTSSGADKIIVRLIPLDWKRIEGWNGTRTFGQPQGLNLYDCKIPVPSVAPDRRFFLRMDFYGKKSILASNPQLEFCPIGLPPQVKRLGDPRQLFYLNGDHSLVAQSPAGALQPLQAENVRLVPGISGKGMAVPANGRLNFAASDFDKERGTISAWFKINWELESPGGNATPGIFNNIFVLDGMRGKCASLKAKNRIGLPSDTGLTGLLYPHEWHHVVLTWNGKEHYGYWDGKMLDCNPTIVAAKAPTVLALGQNRNYRGLDGVIDEVCVYNEALTAEEVGDLYAKFRPVTASPLDMAATAGEASLRILFDNVATTPQKSTIDLRLETEAGKPLQSRKYQLELKPRSETIRDFTFRAPAGFHRLKLRYPNGLENSYVITVVEKEKPQRETQLKRNLVAEIDCTSAPVGQDAYYDDGNCRVVTTPAGKVRECFGKNWFTGFAYRIGNLKPGRAYWLDVDYPDDGDRSFYVAACPVYQGKVHSAYNDSMGIITGFNHPLSHKMLTKKLLFWADHQEYVILFGRWRNRFSEAGPACSKFRVYEQVGRLPAAPRPIANGREIGIWQEDPTMFAGTWFKQASTNGKVDYPFWKTKLERMVEYMDYMGHTSYTTLGCDYFGDLTGNIRRNNASLDHAFKGYIFGYLDMMATMFDHHDKTFYLLFNNRFVNRNRASTFERFSGKAVPKDIYEAAGAGEAANNLFTGEDTITSGMDPIHPKSVEFYRYYTAAWTEKFGSHTSYNGVEFLCGLFYYADGLNNGYGDWQVNAFRRETGVKVPEFTGLKRFGKRREWLLKNAREAWIDWRCRHLTAACRTVAQELGDRKMVLRVALNHLPDVHAKLARGIHPRDIVTTQYREMGLDLKALETIPNLVLLPQIRPNYSQTGLSGYSHGDERSYNFSEELRELLGTLQLPAAMLSGHSCMEVYNKGAVHFRNMPVQHKDLNSYAMVHANKEHALENAAFMLAAADLRYFRIGWWGNPECGVYEPFRNFYAAFRQMPNTDFKTVSGLNDPVAVRYADHFIYCVNWAPFAATVKLKGRSLGTLTNAVTGETCAKTLMLQPGQLIVLKTANPVKSLSVKLLKNKKVVGALKAKIALKAAHADPNDAAAQRVIARAQKLYSENKYAAASYALQDRSIRRLGDVSGPPSVFFNPQTMKLDVTGANTVSVMSFPKNWAQAENGAFKARIAEETDYEFALDFGNGYPVKYTFYLQSAGRDPQPPLHYQVSAENTPRGFPFKVDYAYYWTPEGLGIKASMENQQFYPPLKMSEMYRNDCLQIYVDSLNKASQETIGIYPDGVVTFQCGLVDKKPLLWRDYPNGLVCDKAKVSVSQNHGHMLFDVFIPAEYLPKVAFRPGSVFGLSLFFNNRDSATSHAHVSTRPHTEGPYMNPYVWNKLILK